MRNTQWKRRGRLRRLARRSSVVWWTAAVVLGLITATVMNAAIRRSTDAADSWGTDRRVWVVRHEVRAGDVLVDGDVTLTRRPKGLVPSGALDAESSPIGEATRIDLMPGEVVLTRRLAGRGAHGVAALVTSGRRAIALKNDETMPLLRVGDRVDVLATFDVADDIGSAEAATTAPSFAVATGAEVLTVSARTVTISVDSREAPRVAFALARAAVTVALRGGANEPEQSR